MTSTRARSKPERRRAAHARARRQRLLLAGGAAALAVVLLVAVVIAGGGDDGTGSGDPAPRDTPAAGQPAGATAADFSLPTADGGDFRLADHRGKVVVLNFVAVGCPSCGAEIPALAATADTFSQDQVRVVVVDLTGPGVEAGEVVSYYTSVGGNDRLVYALDATYEVAQAYGVNALGTTVVVDPTGTIRFRDDAMTSAATLEARVEEAMT